VASVGGTAGAPPLLLLMLVGCLLLWLWVDLLVLLVHPCPWLVVYPGCPWAAGAARLGIVRSMARPAVGAPLMGPCASLALQPIQRREAMGGRQ